ncbi:MAG: bifunctional folylpolyglutamate synthase/dihydrofolate synthase [Lachnospiraceae bacterium]|nr:bifunctional folylpolyglutamate synthase/dihydrofolate synthase [Lachnospiraceae bacterium]
MTYQEAEKYILDVPKFTKKNGLDNTRELMKELGNPERNLKVIHVAGTNGKGSVCAFTSSILIEAGKKTGLFTSPHLVRITERFRIDGVEMSEQEFAEIFEQVKKAVDNIMERGFAHPTFFELLFAMALVYFETHQVEYVVLETGLGGRLDSTNVIESPVMTAITSISLDHTEYLGETITEIAAEKAGIIKENVPLILGINQEEVVKVIEAKTKEKMTEIYKISEKDYKICEKNNKHIDFLLNVKYYGYVRVSLPYSAKYQVENAVVAIRIIEKLLNKDEYTPEMINRGLNKRLWQGRMEQAIEDIYFDGAHNEDGIRAFLETAKELTKNRECVLLFGAVKEKNYEEMIKEIATTLKAEVTVVTTLDTPRSMEAEQLRETFKRYTEKQVICCENTETAWKKALELKNKERVLFCVGSLYLVGELKAITGESNNDKF